MELRDKNIFILGLARYGTEIESTTFTLARQLAKHNTVFYIENPYTWKDVLLDKEKRGRRSSHSPLFSRCILDTDMPSLKVMVTPPLLSINWMPEGKVYRSCLRYNQRVLYNAIRDAARRFAVDRYIFINSFNFYYPDLGNMLQPDLKVYHCVDPLTYDTEKRHGLLSEQRVVRDSDIVICTSKQLYNEKVMINSNTHFIPNAADIDHSSKALQPHLPVHPALQGIKRPIAGYFGNIERRMDYDLLDAVTSANPGVSFVFAGPVIREFIPSWFYERPNIHLTGPVPYDQMPNMLKGFDVALIPFRKDEFSSTIFPLKLFEYLGAGKAVIATDFNPDLRDFTDAAVAYCGDPHAFSEALHFSLANDSILHREVRTAIAARNTWERRGIEFAALLHAGLQSAGTRTNSEERTEDILN